MSGIEEGKEGLPGWIWFVVGVVIAFIASFVVWRRLGKKQVLRTEEILNTDKGEKDVE
ncbi:hypothetical protein ES703_70411 [subsurface metagenome]